QRSHLPSGITLGRCPVARCVPASVRPRFGIGHQERRNKRHVPTPNSSTSLSRMAWIVVAVLMPVALLNYLDRQMLASMKDSVMGDIPSIGSGGNWGSMPATVQ